jgi:Domain of unknown function (DUF4270)
MLHKQNKFIANCFLIVLLYSFASCDKTTIQFGSDGIEGDPNITVLDTFTLNVSTLQLDSFSTNNSGYIIAGSYKDPELGYIESKSFFEVAAPTLDLRDCNNCVFDSITFNSKLSSGFMGDTAVPFTLNLHELTQAINETDLSVGYNVSHVNYNGTALASKTFSIRPSRKDAIQIRLPDSFGKNIFRMFKSNSDTITNADQFRRFFKGICMASASSDNAMFYFNADSSTMIKLYYTIAGATPQSKTTVFNINSNYEKFNEFTYDKTGTGVAAFISKKKQVINSTLTNNTGYLHFNSGLFPKISLGNLLFLKELHPYIQVMKAELKIFPVKASYGIETNYSLPPAIELRLTDDENYITGTALTTTDGTAKQYGSLYTDNLYGETTAYTYDVTGFVNLLLSEGVFSKRALIMYPPESNAPSNDQRLLISNSAAKDKAIQLKLYVLGL